MIPGGCVGVILAGGRSSRMGSPKEGVLFRGRPMIEYAIDALSAICQQVVVVGECRGYRVQQTAHIGHLPDLQPGAGPLAGIFTVLTLALGQGYLIVACDQPLLRPELLVRLTVGDPTLPSFFRDDKGTDYDPFPGYYPAGFTSRVQEAWLAGMRSVRRFLKSERVNWVDITQEEAATLRSMNTLADIREAQDAV